MKKYYLYIVFYLTVLVFFSCDKEITTSPPFEDPKKGLLKVTSQPSGAHIIVDNRESGIYTPDSLDWLEERKYRITLRKELLKDTTLLVDVTESGASINVNYYENPSMYGGIECETKPEGAAIFLNDSATGKVTPHSFNNIWPDYYKVTYKLENHREDSVKVGIQSSKIVSAAKKLTDTTSWVIYMPEHYNIPSDQLNHIELDGNIKWIGTNDGGIAKFDGKKFQVFDKNNSVLPSNRIKALFVDKSKKLWIGTTKGLVKKSGDSWELFSTANSPLPSDIINALEEDNLGNIWVGTEKGAAVYESGNWRVYNSQHGQISIENVTSIAMDNQNRIWISTLSDGLFIYNGNEWSRLSVDNDEIFPGDAILEIDFAPDGTKWVGFLGNKDVQNGSLATDKTGEWSHYLHEKRIYDIYFHDNETWVCTNVFLMRFINEPGDGIIYNTDNSQISSNIIRDIEIDNNGFLWIATTRGGLVKYKEAY